MTFLKKLIRVAFPEYGRVVLRQRVIFTGKYNHRIILTQMREGDLRPVVCSIKCYSHGNSELPAAKFLAQSRISEKVLWYLDNEVYKSDEATENVLIPSLSSFPTLSGPKHAVLRRFILLATSGGWPLLEFCVCVKEGAYYAVMNICEGDDPNMQRVDLPVMRDVAANIVNFAGTVQPEV